MRFGSLFSGCGGMDAGLEAAGLECLWQCEKDPRRREVLAERFPGVDCAEDVQDCHSSAYLDRLVRTWYPVNSSEDETMAGKLKKLTPEQAEECVRMYESGLSLAPIAKWAGVSRQSMWDLLRRRTEMRPQKRKGSENHFYRGGATASDQAQNLLETAIKQGAIERKTHCEECGSTGTFKDGRTAIQAHHDDYNKPLAVRWLCQECHYDWHKHNEPIRKTEMKELAPVDIIAGGFP